MLRNFAFERKGDGCQSQKLANVPLECGQRAQRAQTGALMGSVPPVLWRSPAHAQRRRRRRLQQPAGRMDAHSSASSHCSLTGGRGRGHIWWSGHSLLILSDVRGGKKITKIRRTAVFAHFRKPGNYLRYSAPLHPFPGIMMLRDRHPPPTITTDQNLIYVQSDNISLHPITATIMQSPLRMSDACPLNSSLDLHAFIMFHLLLI